MVALLQRAAEFISLINKIPGRGTSYLQSFYEIYDQFVRYELGLFKNPVSCCRGCTHCCYQLILVTEIEMDLMVATARALSGKKKIDLRKRGEQAGEQWREYLFGRSCVTAGEFLGTKGNTALVKIGSSQANLTLHDWWGKSLCPFLNEKDAVCDVYSARPLACRALFSFVRCNHDFSRQQNFNLIFSGIAEMLLFSRLKAEGEKGRTAVPNWFMFKKI